MLWPLLIAYATYLSFTKSHERGGRAPNWARDCFLFHWFAKYFPIQLHKTADLDPTKNYLFGYHPHGIFGLGSVASFGSEACGFSKKFPGLIPHVLTLQNNFYTPIYREWLMLLGYRSVSRSSCESILRSGPGESIVIVVGGAQESLAAHAGFMDLTLKCRLGFIKVALRTGASLVPVVSFGENEMYYQVENDRKSTLYKIQQKIKAACGFTMPILVGRGFFHRYYGWLPYQRPINVVGMYTR